MKEVILYLAISLDGYLAGKEHNMDWLEGDGSDPSNTGTYSNFYETIDAIVMGFNTYSLIDEVLSPGKWPYSDKKSYVITHRSCEPKKNIVFSSENLRSLINRLKEDNSGDIWICGGSNLVMQLLELDLISKFQITIVPKILGEGIPLFSKLPKKINLKLVETKTYNGFVDLVYSKN